MSIWRLRERHTREDFSFSRLAKSSSATSSSERQKARNSSTLTGGKTEMTGGMPNGAKCATSISEFVFQAQLLRLGPTCYKEGNPLQHRPDGSSPLTSRKVGFKNAARFLCRRGKGGEGGGGRGTTTSLAVTSHRSTWRGAPPKPKAEPWRQPTMRPNQRWEDTVAIRT